MLHLDVATVEHLLAVDLVSRSLDGAEQAALRAVYAPRFPARACLATLWATVGGGPALSDDAVPAALAVRPLSAAELRELREVYVQRSAAAPRASLVLPCHAPLAAAAGTAGAAAFHGAEHSQRRMAPTHEALLPSVAPVPGLLPLGGGRDNQPPLAPSGLLAGENAVPLP